MPSLSGLGMPTATPASMRSTSITPRVASRRMSSMVASTPPSLRQFRAIFTCSSWTSPTSQRQCSNGDGPRRARADLPGSLYLQSYLPLLPSSFRQSSTARQTLASSPPPSVPVFSATSATGPSRRSGTVERTSPKRKQGLRPRTSASLRDGCGSAGGPESSTQSRAAGLDKPAGCLTNCLTMTPPPAARHRTLPHSPSAWAPAGACLGRVHAEAVRRGRRGTGPAE